MLLISCFVFLFGTCRLGSVDFVVVVAGLIC